MKKYLLLTSVFISFSIFSQENFVKGIVKKINGKTIHGFIDYQNWKKNPTHISFKETLTSSVTKFSPQNLVSFNVLEDVYISKNVTLDKTSRAVQNLPQDFQKKKKTKKVFLKLLFESDKSLYHFIDVNRKRHFYIEREDKIEELIYTIALVDSKKIERKIYRNQLSKYLQGCPSLKTKIANIRFSKNDFLDLFKEYNTCIDEPVIYIEKKEKAIIRFGMATGFVNSLIDFSANTRALNNPINNSKSTLNFTLGGSVELILPRNRGKNSLYADILYYKNILNASTVFPFRANLQEFNEFEFSSVFLKVSSSYRYNFPLKKVIPFFSIGIVNTIALKQELKETSTIVFFDDENTREFDLENKTNYNLGFLFGTGIKIKRLSLEAKFEIGSDALDLTETIRIKNNNLFVVASYNIF